MKNKLAMSFRWVGVMLICMGIIFLGVGTFVGYYALTSGEIPAEEIVALSVAFLGMFCHQSACSGNEERTESAR